MKNILRFRNPRTEPKSFFEVFLIDDEDIRRRCLFASALLDEIPLSPEMRIGLRDFRSQRRRRANISVFAEKAKNGKNMKASHDYCHSLSWHDTLMSCETIVRRLSTLPINLILSQLVGGTESTHRRRHRLQLVVIKFGFHVEHIFYLIKPVQPIEWKEKQLFSCETKGTRDNRVIQVIRRSVRIKTSAQNLRNF